MIKRCLLLFFLVGSIALAQDEPPLLSNWCDEGNRWGDGRCNTGEFNVDTYMWQMGWYLARLEEGVINLFNIPEQFRPDIEALPPVPTIVPTPPTTWIDGAYTCFINSSGVVECYLTCGYPLYVCD